MTWTQGQPNRGNQPPFNEPEHNERAALQQPPVARTYTRANDRRPDYRQRQNGSNGANRQQTRSHDVAATFTQEGLETFSSIFGTSVEAAITKVLPDVIERSLERTQRRTLEETIQSTLAKQLETTIERLLRNELESAFFAVTERLETKIKELLREQFQQITSSQYFGEQQPTKYFQSEDNLKATVNQPASVDEQPRQGIYPNQGIYDKESSSLTGGSEHRESIGNSSRWNHFSPRRPNGHREEVGVVIEAFKQLARPIRTSELPRLIQEVHWGTNPSAKISHLMNRSDGRIQRVGRGVYTYQPLAEESH